MSRGVIHLPPVRHVSLIERSVCVSVESRVRAERVRRAIVRGYFQAHGERNYQRRFVPGRFLGHLSPHPWAGGGSTGLRPATLLGCTLAQGYP